MRRGNFRTCSLLIFFAELTVFLILGAQAQDPNQTGQPGTANLPGVLSGSNPNGIDPTDPSYGLQQGQGVGPYPQNTLPRGANLQQNDQQNNATNNNLQSYNNYLQQQRNLDLLPPDPPTEFQRMVATSTGRMLPVYGASLFRYAPSTFAPLDRVPVTPDYVIGPGDELLIQVWGQVTLNSRFTVDRAGNIYIPQVGTMRVVGLTFAQLHSFLEAQMGKVFRNFDLNVNMGQLRSIQIFVVGQARRPGSYTISSLSTLVDALFVTGGPTPQGSLRHIQVKRSGKVLVDFDMYDLLQRGDKSKDVQLLPGDVLYIPPVGSQIAVAGSVNTPAIYELKSAESTVGDALELAAGLTSVTSADTIRVERVDERRMRSVTNLPLDATGRAALVRDGDLIELNAIVDRYKNGVTLSGNVANPGHYAWKQGMRVRDLFPDKDALITRDYWLKRGRLGQPVLTYLPACRPIQGNTSSNPYSFTQNPLNPTQDPRINSNTYPLGVNGQPNGAPPASSYQDCVPEPANSENEVEPYGRNPYNYTNTQTAPGAQTVQGGAGAQNALSPQNGSNYPNYPNYPNGSQLSGYPLQAQEARPQNNPGGGSASSAAAALGGTNQFQMRNEVKLSEPDIDWSYAVIERQNKDTLTTSLLSFDLGRLVLDGDSSQNLELQPGDVVMIFSKADIHVPQAQQTRFVRLEGEFVSSGVYSVQPGETLQQLVKRAGGFTPDAYLFGSEFTRESTRRMQQQRLNEYIDEISLQSSTNTANLASRNVSALDSAAATAAQLQNQSVISTLRQARSSGRIVLGLRPDSNTVAALPPIPLEDGDTFIVPHVPVTVSVTGAVYDPNSFIYGTQERVGDYLRQAGGPNRDADQKRAYVIRADGSVMSKQELTSLRRNAFEALRVYPGDTIVIPLNLSKGTVLRNVVDIAQIFGQFGLAVAAASIVF
jgi:protein involved in polysaccharide export with SLBB domain